jgi:hypothetical protein
MVSATVQVSGSGTPTPARVITGRDAGRTLTVAERAVLLARRSRFVQEMHTLAGPGASISVQPLERADADRWRLVVSVDAPDGFTVAVCLDTDSHLEPRRVVVATEEPAYAVFLPGSFQGAWSTDIGAMAATLTRLRLERRIAGQDAPADWRRPDFVSVGQPVRDEESGRVGDVAVLPPGEYPIVIKCRQTTELSYVSPARLRPAGDPGSGR